MTVGEHPRTSTVLTNFLMVDGLVSHKQNNWETHLQGFEGGYLDLTPYHEVSND